MLLDLLHENALAIFSSLHLLAILLIAVVVLLLAVEVLLVVMHLVLVVAGVVGLNRNALLLKSNKSPR